MKATIICTTILLSGFIFSCTNSSDKKRSEQDVMMAEVTAPLTTDESENEKDQQIPVQTQQYDSAPSVLKPVAITDWDKKIIKTATVKLEVKKFEDYNEGLHKKIKQYGGYIASEDNFFTTEKSEMLVSIKVPVHQFEILMNELGGTGIKVIERSIKTEDVTGQVVDTKSRLEAKKQMRIKYMEFLKQSKNMTEVLQVQDEINSIQEEIEAATGRIQYLSNQSAYSTIQLTFYEPLEGFATNNDSPSFFTKAVEAFKSGAEFIKTLMLGLISIWPLLILVITGLYFWKRKRMTKAVVAVQS